MPLIIPPLFANIAIQIRGTFDPDPWYVTWGANCQDANGDVQAIGQKAIEAFESFKVYMSQETFIQGAQVTYGAVLDAEPLRQFVPNPGDGQGEHTSAKLPQNCACLFHKYTALGGRKHRGRFFLPGILSEGAVDETGNINGGDITLLQFQADAMMQVLNTGDLILPMVVLHNEPPAPAPDPTPVTSLVLDPVISTQRRRLR